MTRHPQESDPAAGDPPTRGAVDAAMREVYAELKRIASNRLRRERGGHTLQTTDLVHEAYLRLSEQRTWRDRGHFLALAAQAMRRVLIDHARRHGAAKRIGHQLLVPLDDAPEISLEPNVEVLALDQALLRLAALDPQQARVVEMRSFTGASLEDVADALGISRSTAYREWRTAKLWLRRELGRDPAASPEATPEPSEPGAVDDAAIETDRAPREGGAGPPSRS